MKIFLDANIILDTFSNKRINHKYSKLLYEYILRNKFLLFTSCDLITTIYYIDSKIDKTQALFNIQALSKTLKVIEFSNKEVNETCDLMMEDSEYKDLEDTIQYFMAKKYQCDLIISNDKNFTSKDIKLMTSEEFCKENDIRIP
ncbi:MAG: type II toxin-antitoxin system VapC family toxin [Arcobacteraceae bacterium]|nr:type II toxin-antitoxin system VapC family toxin [Arcobacteraceae bacterium]